MKSVPAEDSLELTKIIHRHVTQSRTTYSYLPHHHVSRTTSTIVSQQPDREQICVDHANNCAAAGMEPKPLPSKPGITRRSTETVQIGPETTKVLLVDQAALLGTESSMTTGFFHGLPISNSPFDTLVQLDKWRPVVNLLILKNLYMTILENFLIENILDLTIFGIYQ